ncbi:MAG: hypothetical protein Kow00129_14420 [Thermoleophilia bacterium]
MLNIYVSFVAASAFSLLGALIYLQITWAALPDLSLVGLAFFIGVAIFADRYKVRIGSRTEVSASFLADFLAATILGPLASGLVSSGILAGRFDRSERVKNLFYGSAFFICGGAAGLVYWWVASTLDSYGLVVGGLVAAVVYQVLNYGLFVPVAILRRGVYPVAYFNEAFKPFLPFHIFFLLISLALLYSFAHLGALMFGLLLLPVLGLVYAFRVFSRERDLARNLERFSLQIASSMITALDMKDNYTAQHSAAVANYSYDIARRMGLSSRERNLAHLAGLLHDLGKISVPDEVLNSRRRLEDDEWEIIQGHTSAGQRILSNMSEFEELACIVLHHHEHYDGRGYPHGLAGEEIPLISRIVSVADCYSAMVSDRPYAPRRSPGAAEAELRLMSGSQFDPAVVEKFLDLLAEANNDYRLGRQADFHVQFQKVRFLRDIV